MNGWVGARGWGARWTQGHGEDKAVRVGWVGCVETQRMGSEGSGREGSRRKEGCVGPRGWIARWALSRGEGGRRVGDRRGERAQGEKHQREAPWEMNGWMGGTTRTDCAQTEAKLWVRSRGEGSWEGVWVGRGRAVWCVARGDGVRKAGGCGSMREKGRVREEPRLAGEQVRPVGCEG